MCGIIPMATLLKFAPVSPTLLLLVMLDLCMILGVIKKVPSNCLAPFSYNVQIAEKQMVKPIWLATPATVAALVILSSVLLKVLLV